MKEKTRPKILRRLILTCVSLTIISSFLLISLMLLLKSGVHIQNFSTAQLECSGIQLIWIEKLELKIDNIQISQSREKRPAGKVAPLPESYFRKAFSFSFLFSHIEILSLNHPKHPHPIKITLVPKKAGWMSHISSAEIKADILITHTEEKLLFQIVNASHQFLGFSLDGQLQADLNTNSASGKINFHLSGQPALIFHLRADEKELRFRAEITDSISSIEPFFNLFNLHPETQKWAFENIHRATLTHLNLSGTIPWRSPLDVVQTMNARAEVSNCTYSFTGELSPISAPQVELFYANGIFKIVPKGAVYAKHPIRNGSVLLDFTSPEELKLTIHIDTDVIFDDEIIDLLQNYDIIFPFHQKSGATQTDLTLLFNLGKDELRANGNFSIRDSSITWQDNDFHLHQGVITLSDDHLQIKEMKLEKTGLFSALLKGNYSTTDDMGEFSIKLEELSAFPQDFPITPRPVKPITIDYFIKPDRQLFTVQPSTWSIKNRRVNLGKLSGSLEPESLLVDFDPLEIVSPSEYSADISGSFSFSQMKGNMDLILHEYKLDNVNLRNKNLPLKLRIDDGWQLQAMAESLWWVNSTPMMLSPAKLSYNDNQFTLTAQRLGISEVIIRDITSTYEMSTTRGRFDMEELLFRGISFGSQSGTISGTTHDFEAELKGLSLHLHHKNEDRFALSIEPLDEIALRLPWLNECKVKGGSLTLFSDKTDGPLYFEGLLPCKAELVSDNGGLIELFQFTGEVSPPRFKAVFKANMQEKIWVELDSSLVVQTKDIDFNLPNIRAFQKSTETNTSVNTSALSLPIHLLAQNSKIHLGDGHSVLADQFDLRINNGKTEFNLVHGPGVVQLSVEADQFSLVGEKLEEEFMEGLDNNAMLNGGELSFAAKGSFSDFTAIVTIRDVMIEKLDTLNKILSILNTIPSLASFSLPDFGAKGLPVNLMIAGIEYRNNLVTIKTMDLKSPQMNMTGTGQIDLDNNLIDMYLNIITLAKTRISKIPLLGYIMVGKKKQPSITAEVSGSLDNPTVTHSTFRKVPTIPFAMLYRTLTLPYAIVEPIYKSLESDKEEE